MLLLCGTALGTLYSSLSSMLLLTCNKELHSIYTWILGSFNGRGWNELIFIALPALVSIVLMFCIMGPLDLLTGGEKSAAALGVEVDRLRVLVLLCGSLSVSCAVCAGGTIGFVGLIAPHIVRKFLGPKARTLVPFSMIFGAALLLLSDTFARVVIAPGELPAGIITSILGVPFFLALCLGRRK
jgi:iron complex transport system permease protein